MLICFPSCRPQLSRGLVGRMMADPAFVQKMLMEGLITASSSLFWEAQQRGNRFGKELDLVAINTLSLMVRLHNRAAHFQGNESC